MGSDISPVISIVTPSYNQGQFIEETIKSVLAQEGEFYLEYIILDAGSKDDSVEIIRKYDRLLKEGGLPVKCLGITYKWFSEPDRGQTDALNKGLKMAKGEILTYINSDDCLESGTAAAVLKASLEDPEIDVFYGSCRIINERDEPAGMLKIKDFDLVSLWEFNILGQPGVFFCRRVLERNGYFDELLRYAFDYEYWLRISLGSRFYRVPRVNASFRVWKGSKTGTGELKFKEEQVKTLRRYFSKENIRNLPEELLKHRKRIFARNYGSLTRHAFKEKQFWKGFIYGAKAICLYPKELAGLTVKYLTVGFDLK